MKKVKSFPKKIILSVSSFFDQDDNSYNASVNANALIYNRSRSVSQFTMVDERKFTKNIIILQN